MSSDESTLLGQILIKSGLNLDDYGIDVKHLAEGNIELTYVEMQCMLKDNPKTCILSLNLKEELKTSELCTCLSLVTVDASLQYN